MWSCVKCHTPTTEAQKYCIECGAQLFKPQTVEEQLSKSIKQVLGLKQDLINLEHHLKSLFIKHDEYVLQKTSNLCMVRLDVSRMDYYDPDDETGAEVCKRCEDALLDLLMGRERSEPNPCQSQDTPTPES